MIDDSPIRFERKGYAGYKVLKEYRAQCPQTLCDYLKERSQSGIAPSQSFCEPVFGSVLLADISGFTKLSSILEVEDLKRHINNFFTLLLDNIIKKHKGDVIKFCGDACLIMWSCPVKSFHLDRKMCALKAVRCALDLLQEIGLYNSGTGAKAVSLRLHCGMSVGTVYCMSLGDSQRMEFLISGPVLSEVGLAESEAETGELCLNGTAYTLVASDYNAEVKPKGSIKISSARKKEFSDSSGLKIFGGCFRIMKNRPMGPRGRRSPKIYIDTGAVDEESASMGFLEYTEPTGSSKLGNSLLNQLKSSSQSETREYKKAFSRFVHESVRARVQRSSNPGHEAELRHVTTMFIQLLNLDEDFNTGKHQRPQQVIIEILDILRRVGGGALRQYVVDDKGCVVICCFGVPGFSSENDGVRAITAAMRIRSGLKQHDVSCQIGIACGMVYCGYVGSKYRKEYVMMGSSVNLAARLMGKCSPEEILVDSNVHIESHDEFDFKTLTPIAAKGYSEPVEVFSPVKHISPDNTLESITRRSNTFQTLPIVGRSFELGILRAAFSEYVLKQEAAAALEGPIDEQPIKPSTSNKFVIVGPAGSGKTALIDEFLKQNNIPSVVRVSCHLANSYEPYEVIKQLLKASMSRATSRTTTMSPTISRGLSLSETKDQGTGSEDDFDEANSGVFPGVEEDVEFRVLEDVYSEIVMWVEANLSHMKFSVSVDKSKQFDIDHKSTSNGDADNKIDTDEWDRYEFIISSHSRSTSFKRQSSVKASFSTNLDDVSEARELDCSSHTLVRSDREFTVEQALAAEETISFGIMEVLPLLRICLDTADNVPDSISLKLTEEGINDVLISLASEIIKALLHSTRGRVLIVEDLQWCDKESFAILLNTVSLLNECVFVSSMRSTEESAKTTGRRYVRCASFEGHMEINSIDQVESICRSLRMKPFSRQQIELLIRSSIKPSLLSSNPNVVSGKNISNILVRSRGGVPGEVVTQIRQMQAILLRSKFGTIKPSLANRSHELPKFDKLPVENQIVLKMASVCGTTFSLFTVNLTLEKMGYLSIKSRTEKILVEIEEKGLIKRVFGQNDKTESKGQIVSAPSPKAEVISDYRNSPLGSFRGLGGSFRSSSFRAGGNTVSPKMKMYMFVDKSFRENVYSVLLESQRESVHRIIAQDLEETYLEQTFPSYQQAETLAFHYTKARDEAKQIYFTQQAALRARETFMPLTAFHQLSHLFLLVFNQQSVEQVLQSLFKSPKSSYYENYKLELRRHRQFGNNFVSKMYLLESDLKGKVETSCSLIPSIQAAYYVAEMSILKYKICDLNDSFNLGVLANHMLHTATLPISRWRLSSHTKEMYAMMYFYQGDIFLMRGMLGKAHEFVKRALDMFPRKEDKGERFLMVTVLNTIQLFKKGVYAAKQYTKKVQTGVDRGSTIYSCIQLHKGVVEIARGDVLAAQDTVNGAATRMLRKDSSPLPLQVENVTSWLHYIRGNPQLLHDCLRSLSGSDQLLRKIWSLELIIVIYIMKGEFKEARAVLSKLRRLQSGRFGVCFYSALLGFLSTFEKRHCSEDVDERDGCINSIIFAADKMSERTQTSPIGMVCLFFVAYAGQNILGTFTEKHRAGQDVSAFIRKGGGVEFRLNDAARRATESLKLATKALPMLQVLMDVLTMQRLRLTNSVANPALDVEYFVQYYRREDIKQFVFGLAFWHHEKALYCQEFNMSVQVMEFENTLGPAQASATMSNCYERLGITRTHPLFGGDM